MKVLVQVGQEFGTDPLSHQLLVGRGHFANKVWIGLDELQRGNENLREPNLSIFA